MTWLHLLPLLLAGLAPPPKLKLESHTLRAFDGRTRSVELGRLSVPGDRAKTSSRIEVGFYRYRSKTEKPGSPIVFLMGGPGIAGTLMAQVPPYFTLFDRLSERTDVIVLDQRGLGTGSPRLDCPPPAVPPSADLLLDNKRFLGAFQTLTSACAGYWRDRDVELGAYSVQAVAEDLEDLRVALGAEQLDLLAFSYGTRIGLEFIRRHPRSVHRAVLQGTNGPDHAVKLPADFEALFGRVAELAAEQAEAKRLSQDLKGAFQATLRMLEQKPLMAPVRNRTGQTVQIQVGKQGFASLVALKLGDNRLPALITLVQDGEVSVLAPLVQAFYQDLEAGGTSLMGRLLVCSAPASPSRAELAQRQATNSPFGELIDNLVQAESFCRAIGAPPPAPGALAPIRGTIPTLFITGTLDDRTPVRNAEEIRQSFPTSVHLVVENGGHELLSVDGVQEVVADFFAGRDVSKSRLALPKPVFESPEEAAKPRSGPPGRR